LTNVEGAPEKAIDLFAQASELDPNSTEMREKLAYAREEIKED